MNENNTVCMANAWNRKVEKYCKKPVRITMHWEAMDPKLICDSLWFNTELTWWICKEHAS